MRERERVRNDSRREGTKIKKIWEEVRDTLLLGRVKKIILLV
jgi:DNA mismatch repair protein MutH